MREKILKKFLFERFLEYGIFGNGRKLDELGTSIDKVETWFIADIGLREGLIKARTCWHCSCVTDNCGISLLSEL